MENFVGSMLAGSEHPYFYVILDMFPNICPNYLRKRFLGKGETEEVLNELTTEFLEGNYKRVQRPLTKQEVNETIDKHQMLISLLPDADPVYLMDQVKDLIRDPDALNLFVTQLLENKKYPLKSEYIKNLELIEQEQKYVKKFDIEYFLQKIPNPSKFFESKRVSYQDNDDYFYALRFLKDKYHFLHFKEIVKTFDNVNCSVIEAAKILDTRRTCSNDIDNNNRTSNQVYCKNISLLQEIAYVQNKTDILDFIKIKNEKTIRGKKLAEEAGIFYTCECCFSEEVTPYDVASCQSGHIFCITCVRKSCEVTIGEGKVDFPCLTTCGSQFSLRVLQSVLSQKIFSKMAQRKQFEEMRQAEIDDLVFCPFCDFATILPPEDKIVCCLNEDCMKETCRLCKKMSHIPLTCQEIQRQEKEKKETDDRTYIEERISEALIRKCPTCSKCFLKESGCNKMTCTCGTLMCYVCKRQISGYDHFQEGGCPLYSNTNTMHGNDVRRGAQKAKENLRNVQL